MTKVNRTLRMEKELSKKLDSICIRHGDITWHVEKALTAYLTDDLIKRIRDKNDN